MCFFSDFPLQPNSTEIHLDPIDIKEVYNDYKNDPAIVDEDEGCYSSDAFRDLWRDVFPHVKIRQYKSVAGKCDVCERLKALMKVRTKLLNRIFTLCVLSDMFFYSIIFINKHLCANLIITYRLEKLVEIGY